MSSTLILTNTPSTVVDWLMADVSRVRRGLQLIVLRRAVRLAYARFVDGYRCDGSAPPFPSQFIDARVATLVARAIEVDEPLAADTVVEAWLATLPVAPPTLTPAGMAELRSAAAELLARIDEQLGPGHAPTDAQVHEPDPAAAARFAEAVRAGSTLELDWLWLGMQLTGSQERRYCFERALEINPHSEAAGAELAVLDADFASSAQAVGM